MSLTPANSSAQDLGIDLGALNGMTQDSRAVEKGYLFAALQGEATDGRDYIPVAIKNGATLILSDKSVQPQSVTKAKLVTTDNPRKAFAHLVSEFYTGQPDCIAAVTGTNGKSSVVHFADQLWRVLGKASTYIGTLSGTMTTPDPVSLHKLLAQMSEEGISHLAIEASSHGLAQHRIDGMHITVAAFTSFSQDHLDYHTDMSEYLTAKTRLFSELLPLGGAAVLNADSEVFDELSAVCKRRGIRVLSYGKNGRDLKLAARQPQGITQDMDIEIFGNEYSIKLPLVGHFQVMNILCALGCVLAENSQDTQIISTLMRALETIEGVPGRLQHVTNDNGRLHAFVDYAHTPDALENVLEALRPHTKGRLICIFGCGGDRDTSKRPLMGEIAARLSDIAIVTDDNPRSEMPAVIRASIMDGMKNAKAQVHNIEGRREAIKFAVCEMKEDDVLLIAGKGHEQGQTFNGRTEPFDDVCEVLGAMRKA